MQIYSEKDLRYYATWSLVYRCWLIQLSSWDLGIRTSRTRVLGVEERWANVMLSLHVSPWTLNILFTSIRLQKSSQTFTSFNRRLITCWQVFEAEKMTGKFGYYHKKCFKCFKCRRPLDYNNLAEGPDSEIYCNNCYALEHGHKSK